MAKMVGVWIWVAPRDPADDVTMKVGGTLNLTQQDVQHIGQTKLQIQIWDDDTIADDKVGDVEVTFDGPFDVGPNPFQRELTVDHDDVADSEPSSDSKAELYAK